MRPSNCRYVIYDPTTYDPSTQLRQPYANNVITESDPNGTRRIFRTFRSRTDTSSPDPNNFNNWSGTTISGLNNNNYTVRVDYNFSSRDNVYFRYLHDSGSVINEGGLIPERGHGRWSAAPREYLSGSLRPQL